MKRNIVLLLLTLLFCWLVLRTVQQTSPDRSLLGFQPEVYEHKSVMEWPVVGPMAAWWAKVFEQNFMGFDPVGTRRVHGKTGPREYSAEESWGGSVVLPQIHQTLYLAAASDVDRAVVDHIAQALREAYALDVSVLDAPYVVPPHAPAPQLDGDRLLNQAWPVYKDILARPDTFGLLIVIGADMRSQGLNFIFGTANIPMRYGLISIARFAMGNPSQELLMTRATKQAFSTVGFIAGIGRCPTPNCARAYPNSVWEHDRKSAKICNICLRRLARAYDVINQRQLSADPSKTGE